MQTAFLVTSIRGHHRGASHSARLFQRTPLDNNQTPGFVKFPSNSILYKREMWIFWARGALQNKQFYQIVSRALMQSEMPHDDDVPALLRIESIFGSAYFGLKYRNNTIGYCALKHSLNECRRSVAYWNLRVFANALYVHIHINNNIINRRNSW